MSAVTRIIYTFFLLPMLVILSACSDSGSESEISIDDRRLNIDTPFSVLEGGDGDVSIIEVSFVSTVTGTISYSTFNVTAASRSDYIPVAGDIEVTEGVEYTINISIEGDDQIEGDELIGLSLTLNGEDLVTYYGRIENDDLPPVTIKTTSVLEGDTGTSLLRFTISLDEEVVDPYTFALVTPVVDVSLNDPENDIFYAIPDIDFEAIDQNITFTEGVSEISIDVVVLADNVIELDERVFIQLNPLQNGLSAEGLIRTDDAVDINGFDLSSVSSEILEGTSASVTDIEWGLVEYLVTVDRPENIIDEQVVQIKLIGKDEQLSDGSTDWASLGEDYCANPVLIDGVCDSVGSYVLEPGIDSTSLMVSFYVRKDLDVEESEEIEIQLQNDQGVVFGNFRHTIIQDDNPSLTVSYLDTSGILQTANLADLVLAAKNDGFTIEILEPADSDSQSVSSIWFNLDFPLKDEFKPSYEFSEVRVSQIGVSDYYVENAGAGVITFAENSTATTNIDVTALHDDDYEGREVLNLEIEDFGVIPITIIDNDLPILKITETTGADILRNDAHFSAITLSESLSANSSDATTTYNFNFALEGGIEALDDLNFSYEINDDFFTDNETAINNIAACTYLKDDNRNRKAIINGEEGATEVPDYQILIGGSELAPNTDYIFEKTKPKLEFSMVVNNDEFVECLEFIFLKFTLSPITNQADDETVLSSTIDVNFEITNTDKATLKVVGWNTDEGSSDQAPLATTNKNFSLALDQAIVTSDIQYTLTSSTNDALSCGDDLQGITVPYVNTVSFNGSDTDLNKAIGVLIQQDNIVEPEEACQLSISITPKDSVVIDVEYFNETGKNTGLYAVDLVNSYASGVIQNDDNLIVTVTTPADSTIEEPVTTGDTLSIGTYSWNKVIAANVGKIAVTATQQDCAADDECIDAADTSFGTHTNATPATKEMIIHTGAETEALAFEERSLPIIVNGDNEVENPENLTFNLAISSGNEYIDLANSNLSNRSIDVTSLDTLSVFLEENNALNTCGDDVISPVNSERDCERVFNIKFSEDISEDVMDLNVNLSIDTDDSDGSINTVNIKGAGSIDYVDAIISIKENSSAAGYTEATPVENNVSINILQGGVVQEPSIKIAFVNDDVVEIDETLLLSLQAVGSNGFYGVDTSRDTISQFVNNDDKLTITYTQFDSFELNEAPDAQVQPYTYTWDKDIAPNVPTIQFAFEAFCDVAADHNCAESNNDFDIPSNNDLVTIHTETTSNYTEVPATALSLGVYYMLDTRVEEDEVLEIEVSKLGNSSVLTSTEGQAFIEFLKLGATTESNQINLSSIIRNDDFLNLTVTNTTDTDAACSGFSEESGCNVFSISWGSQVVDADTGNIIVPLNLPLLDSHTRYAADGSTNPKDYSVKLDRSEITYSDGANSLNLGAGLGANESIPLIIDINNDNFVEPEEALTVSLNATGSPYVAKINDNAAVEQILSHTIPIDDLLRVTVTGNNTAGVEAGDTSGIEAPFSFSTDKVVAPNTPNLAIAVNLNTCTEDCATLGDQQDGKDFTLNQNVPLHTNTQATEILAVTDLGVAIQPDTIVENSETLSVDAAAASGSESYLQFVYKDEIIVPATDVTSRELAYTITNVDALALAIEEITNESCSSGFTLESGCREFKLSWTQETEGLSDPLITINTHGTSTTSNAETKEMLSGVNTLVDPQDYEVWLSNGSTDIDISTNTIFSLNVNNASNHTLKVSLQDDNFVEVAEVISLYLSTDTSFVIAPTNSIFSETGRINHTIPSTADKVTVSVATAASAPEPGDTGGLATPFSFTTDKPIAKNVPTINLTVAEGACSGNCAVKDNDYTLPAAAIDLHTYNEYGAPFATTDLGVAVTADNVVESDETIQLTLSVNQAAYVLFAPNDPSYLIDNTDALDLEITDVTDSDTGDLCTGFDAEENGSCRKYNIAWTNILQSGSAAIVIEKGGDHTVSGAETYINTTLSDPKDYSISPATYIDNSIELLTLVDNDGVVGTTSMDVIISIEGDEFIEPSEKLDIFFSKPAATSIGTITGYTAQKSITHTIGIDDELIVTFAGDNTSGDEPIFDPQGDLSSGQDIPFTFTTTQKITSNTPNISISATARGTCGSGNTCASSSSDYSVTSTSVHVYDEFTDVKTDEVLGVSISPDDIVEVDETLKVRFTENSDYINNFGNKDLLYTIDNNDKTVLSFVSKVATEGDEKHSGNLDVAYEVESSLAISSDVPDLYFSLGVSDTSSIESDDVTYSDRIQFKNSIARSAGYKKSFDIEINGDEIVEIDEILVPEILVDAASSLYTSVDSSKNLGAVHTIKNDDYVYLYLTDTGSSAAETSNGVDKGQANVLVDVKWTGAAVVEGLPAIQYGLNVTNGTTTSTDYQVVTSPSISVVGDAITENSAGTPISYVLDDNLIEDNETLDMVLELAGTDSQKSVLSQFIKFSDGASITNSYDYTIYNRDYLSLSTNFTLSGNSTNQLIEAGAYNLSVCEAGKKVQDTNATFSIMPAITALGLGDVSNSYTIREAVEGVGKDYVFTSSAIEIPMDNFDDSGCYNQLILTTNERAFDDSIEFSDVWDGSGYDREELKANQNSSFKMTYTTSDSRCDSQCLLEDQVVTIINNDLINMLDTGLEECVYGPEIDKSNFSNDSSIDIPCVYRTNDNYKYQDGYETTYYPALAYTYITNNGNASPIKPDTATDGVSLCFQDNATGFIWSSSSELSSFNEAGDVILADCDLAEQGRDWALPSVQELMTIMNLNPMGSTKPLNSNDLAFNATNSPSSNFASDYSRYWSSDSCVVGVITGQWTVDFISGHLSCNATTDSDTNYVIKVYK